MKDWAASSITARGGAGAAALAEVGAALACDIFGGLVAAFIGQSGRIEHIGRPLVERWIAGVICRLELHANGAGVALKDYAFTLLAAAVGEREAAFLQIGDGAIVVSAGGSWKQVFWPQHGEFANTTNFITSAHRLEALELETSSRPVDELAMFTDGLENLALQKAAKAVHAPFFDSMFPAIRRSTASGADAELSRALAGYLSSVVLASQRRA